MDINGGNGGSGGYNGGNGGNGGSGKATASLVLGIVACVCVFFGYGAFIGIVLGVIGLSLGISARKEEPSSSATAGIVLSIIAIAICAIGFISCVACVGCFSAALLTT